MGSFVSSDNDGRMAATSFDLVFFFQAEDGIRDRDVTGVQTCALPISPDIQCAAAMWSGGVALVLVLGAAHVAARAAGARAVADLSKAVPIALLAGLVAAEPAPVGQAYRWLVFAGLLCSLGGDVWLLFPRGFVAGLFNFLVAHPLYPAAFAPGGPWNASAWALLAPFALVS